MSINIGDAEKCKLINLKGSKKKELFGLY